MLSVWSVWFNSAVSPLSCSWRSLCCRVSCKQRRRSCSDTHRSFRLYRKRLKKTRKTGAAPDKRYWFYFCCTIHFSELWKLPVLKSWLHYITSTQVFVWYDVLAQCVRFYQQQISHIFYAVIIIEMYTYKTNPVVAALLTAFWKLFKTSDTNKLLKYIKTAISTFYA